MIDRKRSDAVRYVDIWNFRVLLWAIETPVVSSLFFFFLYRHVGFSGRSRSTEHRNTDVPRPIYHVNVFSNNRLDRVTPMKHRCKKSMYQIDIETTYFQCCRNKSFSPHTRKICVSHYFIILRKKHLFSGRNNTALSPLISRTFTSLCRKKIV